MDSDDAMNAVCASLLARAGLHVPPDRLPVLLRCYREVERWAEVIRAWETTPADEPANVYDMRTITRASGADGGDQS